MEMIQQPYGELCNALHFCVFTCSLTCAVRPPNMCPKVRSQESPLLLAAEHTDPEITFQFFHPWCDSVCDSRCQQCLFLSCGSSFRCPSRIHSGFAPLLSLGQKVVLLTNRSNAHDCYFPGWGHRWDEVLSPFRTFSANNSARNKWSQGPKWHFHDWRVFSTDVTSDDNDSVAEAAGI